MVQTVLGRRKYFIAENGLGNDNIVIPHKIQNFKVLKNFIFYFTKV